MSVSQQIPHLNRLEGEFIFLTCQRCDADVLVSIDTRRFREIESGPLVAYYTETTTSGGPKLAGISDGHAESFECLACHSARWLAAHREQRPLCPHGCGTKIEHCHLTRGERAIWYRGVPAILLAILLGACASVPKQSCHTTPCGDVCCNNDGRVCPPCWR